MGGDISKLKLGDHLCLIYSDASELSSAILDFAKPGLTSNEKIICVADDCSSQSIIERLKNSTDTSEAIRRGQVSVLTRSEISSRGSGLNADEILGFLLKETENAFSQGYTALRIADQLSQTLFDSLEPQDVSKYEARKELVLKRNGCITMCCYDSSALPSWLLIELITLHPIIAFGFTVQRNPLYVAPEELAGTSSKRKGLEKIFELIKEKCKEHLIINELNEEKRINQVIINSLPVFFVAIDPDGKTRMMNETMLRELGYDAEEVRRSDYLNTFVPPEDRGKLAQVFYELTASGKPTRNVNRVIAKDGRTLIVEWRGIPVFKQDGSLDYFFGLGIDISERVAQEKKLRRVNEELDFYAHAVSHDLRTPITTVRTAAETLIKICDDPSAPEKKDMAIEASKIIVSSAERAIKMIDELLEIAKSDEPTTLIEEVQIDTVLEGILLDLKPIIDERKIRIRIDSDLGSIHANPIHIHQIFSNLISNAVRFVPPDDGEIVIRRLEAEPGTLKKFLIRDNGPGIEPDELEKIFEPFYGLEEGRTGLGLATVRRILRTYGGEIRAYNDDGACFEFTLADRLEQV